MTSRQLSPADRAVLERLADASQPTLPMPQHLLVSRLSEQGLATRTEDGWHITRAGRMLLGRTIERGDVRRGLTKYFGTPPGRHAASDRST